MSEWLTTSTDRVEANTHKFAETEVTSEVRISVSSFNLAILAFVATAGMLFAGFASAYLVRRAGTDWERIPLPLILWYNTVLLLASSATIEVSRTAQHRRQFRKAKWWLAASTSLGLMFLAGQLLAWREMAAQGVYLPTSPYSSFFYMLTAVHGVHLLGGIVGLLYVLWHFSRGKGNLIEEDVLNGCATYWHFVDGVWVFLYLLLLIY